MTEPKISETFKGLSKFYDEDGLKLLQEIISKDEPIMNTEPTYEVNREKLESLSIADLMALRNYYGDSLNPIDLMIAKEYNKELFKRINDIIIF